MDRNIPAKAPKGHHIRVALNPLDQPLDGKESAGISLGPRALMADHVRRRYVAHAACHRERRAGCQPG